MSRSGSLTPEIGPILFLGTQMEIGGAQRVLLEQAVWFHNKGHKVFVAFFYDKLGLENEWQTQYDFQIINLRAWKKSSPLVINLIRLFFRAFRLLKLMYKEKINLIETFTNDSNLIGIPLAWIMGVPIRVACHQGVITGRPQWMGKLQAFMVNRGIASRLVVVSKDLEEHVLTMDGVEQEHIELIHNGFILYTNPNQTRSKFSKQLNLGPEKTFFAITVARLSPQKAHQILIAAIPEVIAVCQEVVFLFIGDGEKRFELEEQAKNLGIKEHLRFLGIRRDVHDIMKISDLMIMPSLWEGFPLAVLEGMASGLPVVGSTVVGIKELLGENERGILVPPKDPKALAKAIILMVQNDVTRERLGRLGKEYVRKYYSMDVMCQKYEDFLNQLVIEGRKGR